MTTSMIQKWTFDGYIRWLRGIKAHYRMRRDWICDAFEDNFHLEIDTNNSNSSVLEVFDGLGRGVTCYDKSSGEKPIPLVSFIPPTAGMFIWLAIHVDRHPDYYSLEKRGEDATAFLMDKLWRELADHLVLFAPGFAFDAHGPHAIGGKGTGYFRLAYSVITYDQTREAIGTFSKVLNKFFRV
jgi:aromatic amino acid aminotransferase I